MRIISSRISHVERETETERGERLIDLTFGLFLIIISKFQSTVPTIGKMWNLHSSLFPIFPSLPLALLGDRPSLLGFRSIYFHTPYSYKTRKNLTSVNHTGRLCFITMLDSEITVVSRMTLLQLILLFLFVLMLTIGTLTCAMSPGYHLLLAPFPSLPSSDSGSHFNSDFSSTLDSLPLIFGNNQFAWPCIDVTVQFFYPCHNAHVFTYLFSFKLSFSEHLLCTRHYSRTNQMALNHKNCALLQFTLCDISGVTSAPQQHFRLSLMSPCSHPPQQMF